MVYRYDGTAGRISAHEPAWAGTKPGAGPRHFCFLPQRRFAYLIDELDSTITAFGYDADAGAFSQIQTISTLPDGYQDDNTCADIHPSPDGRFIYGSNRGHDSIAVFAVDQESGRLSLLQHQSSGGKTPRNFGLSPDGFYLLAANQDSDSVVAYRRDAETGRLAPTGATISIPKPVCVKIRAL
jgi:6-phosphogluconolactonase